VKKFLILLVLLTWHLSMAAPQSTDSQTNNDDINPGDQQAADSAIVADDELEITDSDIGQPDTPDEAEEGDSPARFIPTEQISQDLGVSFPVDI
jgi:hypothetical protein